MKKKTKEQIIKEIYEHGKEVGFIDGWREPRPKQKTNNKRK